MGRSGGGGGGFSGGGRSGGFSGGGRRSGGFSGGGFGGGRSGGRSGGGGFGFGGPRPAGGPRRVYAPFFGGWRRPVVVTPGAGVGGAGCGGCGGWVLGLVLAVLLVSLISSFSFCGNGYGGSSYGGYGSSQTQASPTVREKLPADAVTKTDWYTDADGDWVHSASRLTVGLERFYDKTGVQPYVYILPNGTSTSVDELTARAERLYGELFQDEGHFLLVFCDDGSGSFTCGYTVGTAASAVMDSEALDVLADELDYAYNNAATDEGVFSDAFERTAERIMSAAEGEAAGRTWLVVGGVAVAVLVVGGVVRAVVTRRKAAKAEEKERMEEILNTPLEQFGDKEVEDLADKYEDEEDGPVGGDKD